MSDTVKIIKLKQTCSFCPSQWEGRTDDDRPVYFRYRWGFLCVEMGKPGETIMDVIGEGEYLFQEQLGDDLDGSMTTEEMKKVTKEVFNWEE